ncbi:MAG: WD40 repeat domain-containing protein [Acidobacteriaceae bacterium]
MMLRVVTASLLSLVFFPHLLFAQGTRLWVQTRYEDFEKGLPDSTAISSRGYLESAPALHSVLLTPSTYIWAVASDNEGNAYVATGSPATLLKVTPAGVSTKLFSTHELTVQTVRLGPDGSVYAATVPGGKVYRIKPGQTGLDDSTATVVFDAAKAIPNTAPVKPDGARYIWDLAFDSQGALYVATGGPAAIYRVDVSGATPHVEQFFSSDEQHIRCLLFQPDGSLIAGSDGGGLVYRVGKDRKGIVIYNAPKREVTALAESADGRLYVASVGEKTKSTLPPLPVQGIAVATATITIVTPGSVQASSSNGLIPDGSEVDELSPEGAPRKLWATREDVVYALHAEPDGLLAATGNRGKIYRIHEDGSYSDLARASTGQATGFAAAHEGLYVSTSNTGRLYKLDSQPAAQGTYLSDVLDSGVFSRFGRMEVDANEGSSSYEVFARSGNVENPERNWSDWHKVTPNSGPCGAPAARFVQWKVVLAPGARVASVGINYLPVNIAPVVDEIAVEPGARANASPQSSGQPQQVTINLPSAQSTISYNSEPNAGPLTAMRDRSAVTVRWSAHDENGDELVFDVYIRGEGEKNWRLLRARVTDRFYSFDSIRVPDGGYRMRVVASDSPAHMSGDALTGERESDHFIIDTTPPVVTGLQGSLQGGTLHAAFVATDATSPIARAEYSLDAGRWQVLEPVGKLSDSLSEHYDLSVPLASIPQRAADTEISPSAPVDPQEHILTVRVYDRYENASAAKTVVH